MSHQPEMHSPRRITQKIAELQNRIQRMEFLRDNLKHGPEMVAWFNHEIELLGKRLRCDKPELLFDESFKG